MDTVETFNAATLPVTWAPGIELIVAALISKSACGEKLGAPMEGVPKLG
jgi:hypothetical protein